MPTRTRDLHRVRVGAGLASARKKGARQKINRNVRVGAGLASARKEILIFILFPGRQRHKQKVNPDRSIDFLSIKWYATLLLFPGFD